MWDRLNKRFLFSSVIDLIVLDGEACRSFPDPVVADDWLMAPVPQTLPEPELRPAIPDPPPVGDLISFNEFDTDALFAAIDNHKGDVSGMLTESSEFSGESNCAAFAESACRTSPTGTRSSSEADLKELEVALFTPSPVKPMRVASLRSPSPSPRLAGVKLHAEVEADILLHSNSHDQQNLSRNLRASFEREAVARLPQQFSDQERKPKLRKFCSPKVKLAANFSAVKDKKAPVT